MRSVLNLFKMIYALIYFIVGILVDTIRVTAVIALGVFLGVASNGRVDK